MWHANVDSHGCDRVGRRDDEGQKGQEQLCHNKLKSVVSHSPFNTVLQYMCHSCHCFLRAKWKLSKIIVLCCTFRYDRNSQIH